MFWILIFLKLGFEILGVGIEPNKLSQVETSLFEAQELHKSETSILVLPLKCQKN